MQKKKERNELRLEKGGIVMIYFQNFKEMRLSMGALRSDMNHDEKFVYLLEGLSEDYDEVYKIIMESTFSKLKR